MARFLKTVWFLVALTWLFLSGAMFAAHAAEVIRAYHADIAVAKSGELTVTETIRVNAEHTKIRRGIYRDFPLTFTGDDAEMHRVDFHIVSIERDGQKEDYRTEPIDNGIRIYIGNKDRMLSYGEHIYRITYKTDRQIRYFPKHDELFWNVTGNSWEFPINKATARVILPDGVKPEATAFYTGKLGATEKNARAKTNKGEVSFATTIPLSLYEGLTVGVKFAKGAIDPPSDSKLLGWTIRDRKNTMIAAACFLFIFLYFSIQWLRVGRDPSKGVVIPRWDVPAGLSPALVNYVANRGFSNNGWTAFSASAINLAVKGLITLEDLKSTVTLKRTEKTPSERLPLGEDIIYSNVRVLGRDDLRITRETGRVVQGIGDAFRIAIDKEHNGKYHRYNLGVIVWGIVLTMAAYAVVITFCDFPAGTLGALLIPAAIFLFVAIFSALLASTAIASPIAVLRIFAKIFLGFFWLAMGVVLASATVVALEEARSPDDSMALAFCAAIPVVAVFFITIMGAATPLGRELSNAIDGLRLYLTVAEEDRMNFAGAPEMSPRHFEKLLPYAVALGVEKPWSQHFQAWLDATGATMARDYEPTWYAGREYNYRHFGQRMSSFSSSLSTTISSSIPLPPPPSSSSSGFSSRSSSSSSSSGGGSSGSGGGGGGGGGW
jgi:uncharacterized membrane protein YgcG